MNDDTTARRLDELAEIATRLVAQDAPRDLDDLRRVLGRLRCDPASEVGGSAMTPCEGVETLGMDRDDLMREVRARACAARELGAEGERGDEPRHLLEQCETLVELITARSEHVAPAVAGT